MYSDLMHCYRCDARYTPQRWWLVRYHPDTTGNYDRVGKLSEKDCPICRQPPQYEPTPQYNQRVM